MPKSKNNRKKPRKISIEKELVELKKDILRLKKQLQVGEELNRDMKHRIKTLHREIESKDKELKKLDQLKSDFIATISHELRTPLSIIKEGICLVLDGVLGEIKDDQKKFLKMSRTNIDRLDQIITDLLDISKVEVGKIELNKVLVDFSGMVRDACAKWAPKFIKKQQFLKVYVPKSPINICIDPDKIIQVLNSLIANAMRYTPQKGNIKVELIDKQDKVQVSISDTGMGIAKKDLPKTFDKFQHFGNVDNFGEKRIGLGLAISKEFIRMHGGTIEVESKLRKGSKFIFSLPKR